MKPIIVLIVSFLFSPILAGQSTCGSAENEVSGAYEDPYNNYNCHAYLIKRNGGTVTSNLQSRAQLISALGLETTTDPDKAEFIIWNECNHSAEVTGTQTLISKWNSDQPVYTHTWLDFDAGAGCDYTDVTLYKRINNSSSTYYDYDGEKDKLIDCYLERETQTMNNNAVANKYKNSQNVYHTIYSYNGVPAGNVQIFLGAGFKFQNSSNQNVYNFTVTNPYPYQSYFLQYTRTIPEIGDYAFSGPVGTKYFYRN